MAGRPSKRTPEREARLFEALRAGNTRKAACHYAGISDQCLARWLARYVDFVDAVKKAEGDAEVRMVAQIAQAAQSGTWQAATWWLERRRPEDYGRRDRLEFEGDQQITIRVLREEQPIILEKSYRALSNGRADD